MKHVGSYRLLWKTDELRKRQAAAWDRLNACDLCGHICGVNRLAGQTGICKADDTVQISSWGPHFGEEAPLVGAQGSGTIFFTGCNLRCVFCQNWDISQMRMGRTVSETELARVMLSLQKTGCHNINLVTPTHYVPQILGALITACENGLRLPLVYNCGGYESVETLKILDGIVDIYMPDVKYAGAEPALRFSRAKDYPSVVKSALKEMHRQVGDLIVDDSGIACRGLLIRHLVLPEGLAGTEEIVRFIADEISRDTYINIMDQYRPAYHSQDYPPLNRRTTSHEHKEAVHMAQNAGLHRFAR
jgi:putative pyruvate formate lyase activating enzyme